MAQNTNLNVTPYYDDFDKSKNFYRVLYRPGFPIQARELTTSQSILQNQIENIGGHLFKDGAMVIPGQVGYDLNVDCIMLQESFLGAEVENYRSQLDGLIIEGLTSGVRAKVLYSISSTDSDKGYITIYVKYIESGGTKNDQGTFSNNEQLITEKEITFGTTLIEIGSPFAQLLPTAALQTGSVAYVQTGVYYIRGFFVDVPYQYILLDQYGNTPSYRVGLDIQESIITPEDDLSLNDNAAGTSNYAAPGAHRFRITTKLNKKLLTDDADKDFIELLRINGSKIEKLVDRSAYDELEKSLALRTYEESGNYVVSDFQITMRQNLSDGFNNGVYSAGQTTSGGVTAAENLFSVELGPGLAYVRGYRIKTLSPTYVDLEKPRDTDSVQNKIIPFELGNWARINNMYGFPNLTGSTVQNNYQVIELRDTYSGTPGDQQGNLIGYARTAAIEHVEDPDNTFGNPDDKYKINIFDVQMFTLVTLASAKSVDQGSILVGGTSGARGYIVNTVSSNDDWILYQVEGTFVKGEMLLLNGENVDTIADVHSYKFSDTRQLLTRDESTSAVEFTADLVLEDILRLEGDSFTYDATGGSEKITGLNSNFAIDLRPGDRVYFSSTKYVDIDKVTPGSLSSTGMASIFNYGNQTANVTPGAGGAAPTAGEYTVLVRYRGKLQGIDNADLFSPMPKKYIKSISDESSIVRRTFDAQTVASNAVSITLPENEQFVALDQEHYNITVLAGSNSTHPVGDQLAINTTNSGSVGYCTFTTSDRTTLSIANLTNITSIKVTATVSKNVTTKKTKSMKEMFVLKVNKTIRSLDKPQYGLTFSTLYGTRIEDKDISLGLVDAYRLHAIYESYDDNEAVVPSVTLVEPVFFATNTIVTGRTSAARAKVVEFASASLKLSLVYVGDTQFVPGETITGQDSAGNAITGIINDGAASVVKGSKVVTDNFYLEDGQTGFIYDTARCIRKKGVSKPIRQLKIVCDFYQHSSTGDYFSGQSYLNTAYTDIPFFNVNFLADYLDWRPGAKNLYSDAGTVNTPAYVNCSTFDFKSRVFTIGGTTNSTIFDIPKLDSDFRCDFDWYLPRTDKIFLLPNGEFQIVKGKSSSEPQDPDSLKDGMHLATLKHRPYGFGDDNDTVIKRSDNRRYTMRDIGALERRLDQVEYYTSLNMLETDTFNTTIVDSTGKDRFKNGFIVDDFADHSKSDTSHEDFGASLDFREGICRASHYTTNVALILNTTLSTNYQVTGPLISLPYTEFKIIDQPYASRVENVNPFNVFTYIGRIDLTPSSDDWIDTERLPERVIPTEGDFQQVSGELGVDQNGMLPIEWGSWQTNWGGDEEVISSEVVHNQHWIAEDIGKSPRPDVWDGRGMRRINRVTTIRVNAGQSREGIRTRVVPRIDRVSQGDRLISATTIPWVRSRNLAVNVVRMKPRTQFFTFFDGTNIDGYIMPKIIELVKDPAVDARTNSTPFVIGETVVGETSGVRFKVAAPNDKFEYSPYDDTATATSYASTTAYLNIDLDSLAEQAVGDYYGNMQVGEILTGASGAKAVVKDRRVLSDRLGQFSGSFFIPNPGVNTNPRWATGSRTLRFTTSDSDSRLAGTVDSSAETEYSATGTLNTVQENILAIRNAEVVRDTVTEERVINTTRTETRQIGWYDPLAQSFICDEEGGVYLTSVDVYFNTKDTNIPISMQIRTMENGYPTKTILPFSDTTLNPSQVQLSEVGAVATKFTFRAPVYIPQSQEHCFVLLSDSNSYQVWISRMGELDITGDRTISEQPYAGVLFKSQNASTWTADQYEDLKFSIYRAQFDNSGNTQVTLNNAKLGVGNKGVLALRRDPIETFQPQIRLVLNSTTLPYTVGARVYQKTTLAEGTIVKVETLTAGVAITLDNISGTFAQGSSAGGTVTNRIVSSKTTGAMTVTGASGAFTVGETITGNSSGAPTAVVGTWTDNGGGAATFALTSVSDDFTNSTEVITGGTSGKTATVNVFTPSGDAVETGAISDAFPDVTPTYTTDQRKIKVYHTNHAMHDISNNVTLTGLISEISDTYLTAAISATDTSITVNDASAFHKTINGQAISASNVGFIKIGTEIMSYSAISNDGKTMTIQARAQDNTTAASHADESVVSCYNLDGIPLPELNKTHAAIQNPTLDSYEIAVTSLGDVGIRGGGANATATQNLQFENIVPQIQRMILPKTSITARANFISGTSINDGATSLSGSFANDGIFYDLLIQNNNQLTSPKLICSQINESEELSGEKSLRLDLNLKTTATNVSPIIDTDRMSAVLVSNRINNPSNIDSAKLSTGDEHEAVYITRTATLTNSSGAIKAMFAAFRPTNAIIRVLYRVRPTGNTDPIEKFGFEFFPTANQIVPGTTDNYVFKDYEYEVSGLSFDQFQIKIVFASPSQAYSPVIKDFRGIALAI
tara:strand:+ start:563 stop:7789 length:7227 start_codon:yes stop_codon:yes gene_type:complete